MLVDARAQQPDAGAPHAGARYADRCQLALPDQNFVAHRAGEVALNRIDQRELDRSIEPAQLQRAGRTGKAAADDHHAPPGRGRCSSRTAHAATHRRRPPARSSAASAAARSFPFQLLVHVRHVARMRVCPTAASSASRSSRRARSHAASTRPAPARHARRRALHADNAALGLQRSRQVCGDRAVAGDRARHLQAAPAGR
jgi:hypothetical protein